MLDLITPSNFDFFARYLLAGLIIIWIRSNFVLGDRPRLSDMVIEAVILSLFNQLVFLLLVWVLAFPMPHYAPPTRTAFFAEVLALPISLGILLGWGFSRGWVDSLFRTLAIPVRNVKRAYDFAFATHETEGFVILTYSDGTKVFGYFGENSLAANDAKHSDIYIERLYDLKEDGQWFEQSPPRGVWLNLDGLRSIEFLKPERTADE